MFLLVLAGGLVRSTGSGMGCPDWPKCFDQWVPPTQESQLPTNYREIHSTKRGKKINKFANLLDKLGFEQKAKEIREDKSLLLEERFNATKTWIEYVNRLLGALTGLFCFLFAVSSIQFWKSNKLKTITAFLGLILIGFNGWLGSIVVATNLLPGVVSVHFIFAFLAAAVVMVATHNRFRMYFVPRDSFFKGLFLISLGLSLVQIVLGTLVRENVDYLIKTQALFKGTSLDESMMGSEILIHKIWSWVVVVFGVFVFYQVKKKIGASKLLRAQVFVLGIWSIQFLTGVVNIWYALPPISQLIHIVFGSVLFGIQMYICIAFYNKYKKS